MPRKKIIIDWNKVDAYCQLGTPIAEISLALGVPEVSLKSRCKKKHKMEWSDYARKNFIIAKLSLRSALFNSAVGRDKNGKAIKANTQAQLFLSKNWLGYSDNPDPQDDSQNLITALDLQEHIKKNGAGEELDYDKLFEATFGKLDLPDVNGRNHKSEADVLKLSEKKVQDAKDDTTGTSEEEPNIA